MNIHFLSRQGLFGWAFWLASVGPTSQAWSPHSQIRSITPRTTQHSQSKSASYSSSSTRLHDANKKLEILAQKQVSDQQVEELLRNYGEKSRLYRRDVFSSADWIRYRRPDRFIDHLLTIYDSGLLRALQLEMLVLTSLSTFIVLYNDIFANGIQGWNGQIVYEPILHLPALQLPLTPFTLSTAALGLLLTFRTNVSYSRWNEARTAWGAVINDSRSVVRMACIWATSYTQIDDTALIRLGEAVCSFSRTLMNRTLPPQEDAERFLQYTHTKLQDQQYAQMLRSAQHRPTAALAQMTQILVEYQLNPIHQVEVERIVTSLCNSLGACERIYTSPVPIFYTRHTARFLAVWLFCLPLGMYDAFGSTWNHLGLIPACFGLGLFLLGIEELATQMEEPFSILPMERMCEGSIRNPIMEQVQRSIGSERMPSVSDNTMAMVPAIVNGSRETPADFAPTGELLAAVLPREFGIDFAVNGIQVTTKTTTTTVNPDTTDVDADDQLASFFVAQPLSYQTLPNAAAGQYKTKSFMPKSYKSTAGSGIGSYFDGFTNNDFGGAPSSDSNVPEKQDTLSYPSSTHETSSAWTYGGMSSATSPSMSSYMPNSSYKPASGSGMASKVEDFNNNNNNQFSYYSDSNNKGSYGINQPETLQSTAVEPLQYGGIPSVASSWKASSSSFMPNSSYKAMPGSSGLPSYFDNFNKNNNQGSYYSPASNDGGSVSAESQQLSSPAVEPLQYGGMPPAAASWKSSYMPNSSYKSSPGASGLPSYINNISPPAANNVVAEQSPYFPTGSGEESRSHSTTATTTIRTMPSYMPKSYRPSSGSGMPSYTDNL